MYQSINSTAVSSRTGGIYQSIVQQSAVKEAYYIYMYIYQAINQSINNTATIKKKSVNLPRFNSHINSSFDILCCLLIANSAAVFSIYWQLAWKLRNIYF